jgi:hypothetical protein
LNEDARETRLWVAQRQTARVQAGIMADVLARIFGTEEDK